MATDSTAQLNPASALRGALAPGLAWTGSRLTPETIARVPGDTAAAARVPAGLRLELQGSAEALELELTVGERSPLGSPALPLQVSAWVDDRLADAVEVRPSTRSVRLELGAAGISRITVYLPEGDELTVTALRVTGGELEPAPPGPRWLAYGDSITQGWSTTDAGATWPARLARARGLDLVNLGFAGSARGELPVAFQVAASSPEVVTLAWGTNSWSTIPVDGESIAATMRLFLSAIRATEPGVPVLVVSPILRPAAETTPNVFGATLRDLRQAIEESVTVLAGHDPRLDLVSGTDLVPEGELVDGVHPGDAGHARMAATVGARLDRLLGRSS